MIESYKQITGKYLKANKKRTILTIIGIILSVALICSIGLFFKGLEASEIGSIKEQSGSYHLAFTKTNESMISKIVNNPKVSRSGFYDDSEKIKLSDKLSTNVIKTTGKALELLPLKTKEGRFPENKNEIAAESWILRYIDKNAKVSDKVKINNKEYTLVGILEDNMGNQMLGSGMVVTKDDGINKDKAVLLVEISPKTNLKNAVQELKSLGEKDGINANENLIIMEGGSSDGSYANSLYSLLSIVIGVVLIVTIAVIYNSFQISVIERIKEFGLLRAVGTTPKQIRKIVFREATIVAVIGVPIGLLCGVIAMWGITVAFKLLGGNLVGLIKLEISPMVIAISAFVGVAAIYASALLPASFAGKISPLEAISSRTSIKKEKIKKRKSILSRKLFGFEGELASKNIRRNRKRYRITIFSIVISVMLFITFKSFMDMSFKVYSSNNESSSVNFEVAIGNGGEETGIGDNNLITKIENLKSVEKVYKQYRNYNFNAVMDKNREVKKISDISSVYKNVNYNGKDMTMMNASIAIYDKNAIEASKKYLQDGSIDYDKLNSENGVIIVNKNKIYDDKGKKSYIGGVSDLKVGDEIFLQNNDMPENQKVKFGDGKVKSVKVMAVLNDTTFDFMGNSDVQKIITTEDVSKKLLDYKSINPTQLNIMIKNIKDENTANSELENILKSYPSLRLINCIDQNRNRKSSMLMFEILIYGFVIVVSLIGSVNIVNTLTTNIILRRREFATLKAIGLTQKGLRKMIVLEGLLYGISGTIYGSIAGCGISYLIYRSFSGVREFSYKLPLNAVAIAAVCALAIGYISVLAPLSRVKKDNLIDTIREEG